MSLLGNDCNQARIAASLFLTAPGVPFLSYSEEIGILGEKPDEMIRRPMQWSPGLSGGLSAGQPWEALGPGWETANVAIEADDPRSLLSQYPRLIQARNQHVALRVGALRVLDTANPAVYAILRVRQEEAVLVLVNLSGEWLMDVRLSSDQSDLREGSYLPATIVGEGAFAPLRVSSDGGFSGYVPIADLPPYGTILLQLQAGGGWAGRRYQRHRGAFARRRWSGLHSRLAGEGTPAGAGGCVHPQGRAGPSARAGSRGGT